MHSSPFQFSNEVQWEDLGNGIERQLFGFNETIMMVKVRFGKGAVGELHSHMHTQVSYVESGSFEMTIGEEKTILNAGDGFYVHPNVLHGTVCLEPGILVDTFSPAREDFLPIERNLRPLQSKTNAQYVNRAITDYYLLLKGNAKNQ